jgi:hypothetical protein
MRFSKMFVIFLILFVTSGCSSGEPEDNSDNQNETADDFNVLPDSNVPDENIADDEKVDTDPEDPWYNQDDDDDGLPNGVECPSKPCRDTDGDGTDDYLDTDSDDDGIPDSVETPNGVLVDTDEDGTPDYIDTDSDGDGIPDSVEGTQDFDGDGTPNYRDLDSDDDGIFDQIECFEQPCVDSDGDSMPDYLDTDSDDDGIPDLYEGVDDPDKDGLPNFIDKDSDGDGIEDYVENGENIPPLDSDKDGTPDFLDLDSDNDGLSDEQEIQFGSDPKLKDTDGDTFDDFTEFIFGSNPKDPDSGIPENAFYIILPYESDPVVKNLDFSTDIKKVDVLILVDLSGSMGGEHTNLKEGIKTTIIDGVRAEISDSAFGLVKFGTLEDKVYNLAQPMTTNADAVKTAVDSISSCGGAEEYHTHALWQAASGAANDEEICVSDSIFGCLDGWYDVNYSAVNCTGKEGSIGGACFREEALPIMIMASDESFTDDSWDEWDKGSRKRISDAVNTMNSINAKFIGIDSGSSMSDFNSISDGTGSKDTLGNRFNYTITADGLGFSSKIVQAVVELTNNIQIDITTKAKHIDNVYGVTDTTKFIKSLSPDSFPDVKPGQTVTFDVTFENTIYENETYESKVFSAVINVLGDGSFLDSREVFIVVPGKDYTGPGN